LRAWPGGAQPGGGTRLLPSAHQRREIELAVDGKAVTTAAAFIDAVDLPGGKSGSAAGLGRWTLALAPANDPAPAPARIARASRSNRSEVCRPLQYRRQPSPYRGKCRGKPRQTRAADGQQTGEQWVRASVKVTNSRKSLTEGSKASDDRDSPCPGSVRLFHGMYA
jgi:hypothetical protein